MLCSKCGESLREGTRFCGTCGTAVRIPAQAAAVGDIAARVLSPAPSDAPPTNLVAEAQPADSVQHNIDSAQPVQQRVASIQQLHAKAWKTAAFAGIGSAGGYAVWATLIDPDGTEKVHWTWDTWLLTLLTIGIVALFMSSGFQEIEHRLRHGHWITPDRQASIRIGGLVLKASVVSLIVAVSIDLYIGFVLHRFEIAIQWAVQFSIFAVLTYAWLNSAGKPICNAAKEGRRAGARWGFWVTLIATQLLFFTYDKKPSGEAILSIREQYGLPNFLGALAGAIGVWIVSVLIAYGSSLLTQFAGYLGGLAVDKYQSSQMRVRLVVGAVIVCVCYNLIPSLVLADHGLKQFLLVTIGSILGIVFAPPFERDVDVRRPPLDL